MVGTSGSSSSAGTASSSRGLYAALFTSLRESSAHFRALSAETLALGLYGLAAAHAHASDDINGHHLQLPRDRELLRDLMYHADWARAFCAGATRAQIAAAMAVPVSWKLPVMRECDGSCGKEPLVLTVIACSVNRN
jgi:hypothetical protein